MRKTNRLRQGLIAGESLPVGMKKPALRSESRLCNYVWTAALELGRLSLELSLIRPQRWHICIALPTLPALAHDVAGKLLLVGLASQGLIALTHFSSSNALLGCHYLQNPRLGQRAQTDRRRLGVSQFVRTLVNQSLIRSRGLNGFSQRALRQTQLQIRCLTLVLQLRVDGADFLNLFGQQV
jgi:hypothetical protein